MTNFLEIKSKVARCLMVGCAMVMGMSAEADTYDDTYQNTYIALAAKSGSTWYAMTCDFPESGRVGKQIVSRNAENKIVFLTSEEEQKRIIWHTWKNGTTGIILKSESSQKKLYLKKSDKNYSFTTDQSLYFKYNSTYDSFTYNDGSKTYGIILTEYFNIQDESFWKNGTYPFTKPYFLAEHTWRTLGSSFFGTICFPKAVRAAERAGATFYEIVAKIVDGGDFKGIVLREVTGELTAGTPYIFKKNDAETTYIVAAMHGEAADAGSSNGLVGVLVDSAGKGYAVPAGMYILQGDQLWETTEGQSRILEGRAYINPAEIGTTVTSAEVAGVKGYVLGLDEPFDAVKAVKAERSSEGDIRDLQGRRVERVNSGRMYIIGGRKVLIR